MTELQTYLSYVPFGKYNILRCPFSPSVTLLYSYLGIKGLSYKNDLCDLFRTNIDT